MAGSDPLPPRSQVTFAETMGEVMRARQVSVRQLARTAGVSPSHLSRALRGAQDKQPSIALLERLAIALEIPSAYFLEVRRSRVLDQLRHNAELVDELYDRSNNVVPRRSSHDNHSL